MTTTTTMTTTAAPPIRSARADALRDLVTISSGVVPFGIVLGVALSTMRTDLATGLAGAGLVYAGSAQLATTTALHLSGDLITAVFTGVVVNIRILLYGAGLEPWFRGQPLWFRVLGPQFVVDPTYLSAQNHPERRGADFRRYWGWLGFALLVLWLASVAFGLLAAPLLPTLPHLVLVGSFMFLGLLVPQLTDRPALTAAAVGAGASFVVAQIAPSVTLVVGAVSGILAAVFVRRRALRGEEPS